MNLRTSLLQWSPLKIILGAAFIFAIGAVGFFVAIFWENNTVSNATVASPHQLTVDQKSQILNSLNASSGVDEPSGTTSSAPTQSSATQSGAPAAHPGASQADTNDSAAAAKLRILESLNSQ